MPPMRFDNTITMGTVLQIVSLLLALWGLAARLDGRLTIIETKVDPLWQEYVRQHAAGER